jgi:predicted transcriptional regulator
MAQRSLRSTELETLTRIGSLTRDLGRPPTMPELAESLNLTASGAYYRVRMLRSWGLIHRPGPLVLTDKGRRLMSEGTHDVR